MNWLRSIKGFLLSFVFLFVFLYIIAGLQWVFDNSFQNQNEEVFLGSVSNAIQNVMSGLEINAQSAISVWIDISRPKGYPDKIFFSKNAQRKLSIASISKLMTALIVLDNSDLSQQITISDQAVSQSNDPEPLKSGETFYAKDLLYATLVDSDNASSYALSESIGTDKFIELMNEKAKELGLLDTSFLNTTGLGLANFSTAQDLVKLTEYLLKEHRSIFEITIMPEFNLYTVDGKILHKFVNTDELLRDSSNLAKRIVGGKTGKTRTAGECLLLVVTSVDEQGYLINVILNSNDRFGEIKKLINAADAVQ